MDQNALARPPAAHAVRKNPANRTPVGIVPAAEELDLDGVRIAPADLIKILSIDSASRRAEPGSCRRWLRCALTASRARIVATADAARRRIERNLHDGAQQRLVSLALDLPVSGPRSIQSGDTPDTAHIWVLLNLTPCAGNVDRYCPDGIRARAYIAMIRKGPSARCRA